MAKKYRTNYRDRDIFEESFLCSMWSFVNILLWASCCKHPTLSILLWTSYFEHPAVNILLWASYWYSCPGSWGSGGIITSPTECTYAQGWGCACFPQSLELRLCTQCSGSSLAWSNTIPQSIKWVSLFLLLALAHTLGYCTIFVDFLNCDV